MALSEQVHPLVLGQIFRSRQQIRDLAGRLLQKHTDEKDQIDEIVDFLCSESGSHDYTINRREAERLGLNVENCSEELYVILRQLYNSFSSQMSLSDSLDWSSLATQMKNQVILVPAHMQTLTNLELHEEKRIDVSHKDR